MAAIDAPAPAAADPHAPARAFLARRHRFGLWEALPWLLAIAAFFLFPDRMTFGSQVLLMVLLPAVLMVSTIRFRSFKSFDLQTRKPYSALIFIAFAIVAIATHPRGVLVVLAYSYLGSAFVGQAITRFRHRGGRGGGAADDAGQPPVTAAR